MSVSFFRWGSLIPLKVTFQGKAGHEKSKLALYYGHFRRLVWCTISEFINSLFGFGFCA